MKYLILLVSFIFINGNSIAQQNLKVSTFTNNSGWYVGDESTDVTFFNKISVYIEVKKSTLTGKNYYVAYFENISREHIEFGARLTDQYPSRTHFSVSLAPGQVKKWGEHLQSGVREIYLMVSEPR